MATTTTKQSVTVRDISAPAFIKAYAAHLKKTNWLKVPDWVDIVKTGHYKELCPSDPDWFYVRTASVARKIYLRGGTGIGALKRVYGGSFRRGPRPPVFCKGSGKIARYIVQQLRQIGVVEDLVIAGKIRGRKVSREGQKDLDRIAKSVASAANQPAKKKVVKKPAATTPAPAKEEVTKPAEKKAEGKAPAKGGDDKGGKGKGGETKAEGKAPAKGGDDKGGKGKGGETKPEGKAPAKGAETKAPAKGGDDKGGKGKGGETKAETTKPEAESKPPAKGGKQQQGKGGAKK
jgi:small subunit ribosomal protein S19e